MSPTYRDKPWRVYAVENASATVYYYYYYDENGKRVKRSTGIGYTRERDAKKKRRQAEDYCASLFRYGKLGDRGGGMTLDEWVEQQRFFDWRRSKWVRALLARSEGSKASITERYVRDGATVYTDKISPYHGDLPIAEITAADCEDLLMGTWKQSGRAHKTINNWRTYYSTIMAEAQRLGVIESNPWRMASELGTDTKPYGGVTLTEGARIISPDGIDLSEQRNRIYYLAVKTAFLTGLRISEVQGLTTDAVKSRTIEHNGREVTAYYLDVYQQYSVPLKRLTPTKDKERRAIPITPELYAELEQFLTGPDRFVFSFAPDQSMHINQTRLREWLYERMEQVGIADRVERNLAFHSARRFFNTLLRRRVSGDVLRKMTGHDSEEMSEHYTDYLPEDLAAIADAQASLTMPHDSGD